MSVYSTPIKTCFDEGSSPSSNQSFYFTPRETLSYYTPQSRSRKRKTRYDGRVPKFNVYNEELSRSEENLRNDFILSSSPISVKDYVSWGHQNSQAPAKEAIISFGKENIGVQFSSTPSLIRCSEKKASFTPLKNISNSVANEKGGTVFEARISSIGKQHFDLRITTEADVEPFNECSKVQSNTAAGSDREVSSFKENVRNRKPVDKSNGNLFRSFSVSNRVTRKSNNGADSRSVEKSKIMIDVPTQTEADISLKYVCKESKENMDAPRIDYVEDFKNECLDINKISVEANDSRTPLLVEKKPIEKTQKVWPFLKLSRLRISPVKRLFTKSSRYLFLLKQKLGKLSSRPFKPLREAKADELCCPSTALSVTQTQIQHSVCTICLGKLTDKEEMMSKALSTLMLKLSSMEDELNEIKGLLKNNAVNNSNSIRSIQLPPPPPPPPPPNFLNAQSTGALKRKADLTTPENDNHSVKRPAIKNERTHFAITVEDIRSVKLKKTPASALRRESKIGATNPEDVLRSVKMKKIKKNNSGGKKRMQNLAELYSRENVTVNRSSIVDSNTLCTPRRENHSSQLIYEETPLSSKSIFSSRSQKRKELLLESPIRKRINTGNNSTIYSDNEAE